jgi:hypothetical protein
MPILELGSLLRFGHFLKNEISVKCSIALNISQMVEFDTLIFEIQWLRAIYKVDLPVVLDVLHVGSKEIAQWQIVLFNGFLVHLEGFFNLLFYLCFGKYDI